MSILNAALRLTAPVIAGCLCVALAVTGVRAETVVVENVSLGSQGFRIEIPRIEAEGSNLSREAIQALFDGAQTGSLAARLGGWSAESVRMPELRYRQTLPNPGGADTDQIVTYTNLVLSGLRSGTAQRFALDGATSTAGNALVGEITTRMGAARAQDFDLGAAAAYFTRAAGPNEPLRTVYRDFAFDGMQVTGGRGVDVRIGRVTLASLKARPPVESFGSLWALVAKLGEAADVAPDGSEMMRLVNGYADLLTSYEVGPLDVDGVTIAAPDERMRPVQVRIRRVRSPGSEGSRVGGLAVEGVEVAVSDGSVRLQSFEWRGADLAPTLAGLRAIDASAPLDWFVREWRRLVPSVRGVALSGLEIDMADEARPGERVKAGAGLVDVDFEEYRAGIPTQLMVAVRNLAFALPRGGDDRTVEDLRQAGYERVDLSFGARSRWDEAARTIRLSDVMVEGAGMGGARLSLTLGNATADLFSIDVMRQQAAALALTAIEAQLSVQNRGLFERLFQSVAKRQGRKPEDMRREAARGIGLLALTMLGTEAGRPVTEAVTRFVGRPRTLEISARAKDPAGVGALDLMMAGENPAAFAAKLDVQAKAGD